MTMSYQPFKKKIWIGTFCFNLLLAIAVLACMPHLAVFLVFGIVLGWFYLWSLFLNAENPKGKLQFAFSLTRMVAVAYIIVIATQGRLAEFTIVMCGLLSYKGILWIEYVRQALPALKWRQPKPGSGTEPEIQAET